MNREIGIIKGVLTQGPRKLLSGKPQLEISNYLLTKIYLIIYIVDFLWVLFLKLILFKPCSLSRMVFDKN